MIDKNCKIGKIRKNVVNLQSNCSTKTNKVESEMLPHNQQLQQSPSYLTQSKLVNSMSLSMFSALAFQNQSLRKYRERIIGNLASLQENAKPEFELLAIKVHLKKEISSGNQIKFHTIVSNEKEKIFRPKEVIQHLILLEDSLYIFVIGFEVSKEILYGVRLVNTTYKFGIKMDQKEYKIGSFAPGFHNRSLEVKTPSGFLKRGQYKCELKIYDQYNELYGICAYSILIAGK